MGRPANLLAADKIEPALAYLKRAADRDADVFFCGRKEAKRSLAHLRRKALTLRQSDLAVEVNAWLTTSLKPAGRRAMLAALRQQRFVEDRTAEGNGRIVRLTSTAQHDVAKLAELLGMNLSATVALVVKTTLADEAFLANVRQCAVTARG